MVKENNDKPQPPKRPLSAFFLFRQDRYKDVTSNNPNMKIGDITKIIATEWGVLSEEKKKNYQSQYTGSKVIYDKELKEYVTKYGKVEKKKKIKRGGKDKAAKGGKKAGNKKADAKKDTDKIKA